MEHKEEHQTAGHPLHTHARRIELRCTNGPLLGVLTLAPLRLEVKRNGRVYEVDLESTLATGDAVVFEYKTNPPNVP